MSLFKKKTTAKETTALEVIGQEEELNTPKIMFDVDLKLTGKMYDIGLQKEKYVDILEKGRSILLYKNSNDYVPGDAICIREMDGDKLTGRMCPRVILSTFTDEYYLRKGSIGMELLVVPGDDFEKVALEGEKSE